VDCDDPSCAAFDCVPAAPGALAYLNLVDFGDSCPAPTLLDLFGACEDCSCTPSAGWCQLTVESYAGANCTQLVNTLTSGTCANTTPDGHRWFRTTSATLGQGSCASDSDEVMSTDRYGCEQLQAGSCGNGQACVPSSVAAGPTCVLFAGSGSCPGAYSVRHAVWPGTVGACTCGCGVSESCPQPYVDLDTTSDDCTNLTLSVPVTEQACSSGGVSHSFEVPWTDSNVQCQARGSLGGEPTHTLCCRP
jgi:hypothetical protein